jgi:hypothetical protein
MLRMRAALAAVLVGLVAAACGGGGAGSTAQDSPAAEDSALAAEHDTSGAAEARYHTEHDPDATYSQTDITMRGSYLKLNLEGISDPAMNQVIHRMRTEYCNCGCEKDTIDECLINDPSCETALALANQIIREEKLKS